MMEKKTTFTFRVILFAYVAGGWMSGCTKTEYMPPTVGEQIPYTDTVTVTLQEALKTSSHSLFYNAWERSSVAERLAALGNAKRQYTLLVPTNAALAAAGWDERRIAHSGVEALDTLVLRHVFHNKLGEAEWGGVVGSYHAISLLDYPALGYLHPDSTYYFRANLSRDNDRLWVNGQDMGHAESISATNGAIWPVEHVLEIPQVTAWEHLKADSRFSLYTSLIAHTDAQYIALFTEANGYAPDAGHEGTYKYNRHSPRQYGLEPYPAGAGSKPYTAPLNTWFIPTNEAFNRAGFYTLDDLLAYNAARGLPTTEWYIPTEAGQAPYYRVVGEFATDSLLDYHQNWGMRLGGYDFPGGRTYTQFYQNELAPLGATRHLVSSYTELVYSQIMPTSKTVFYGVTHSHYMPFEFSQGDVTYMSVKDEPATRIELRGRAHHTLTGVIHEVDQLMVPSGF